MSTPFDFRDKVVLITGAASGLGNATARRFASGGAQVIVNDLNGDSVAAAAAELGDQHLGISGDVSIEDDVTRCVQEAISRAGKIDVLVNNAGIADNFTPTIDRTLDQWQRLIDVHLTGAYLVSKAVARHMIESGQGGAIVNLNSIAGVIGLPGRPAYSAAKAGIGMLARVLACEWAKHGIRVNCVAPGYMHTPLLQKLFDEGKVVKNVILRRTPMGRLGTADHVADAITFLASAQAEFITGVTLNVDGGYMAYGAPSDAYEV